MLKPTGKRLLIKVAPEKEMTDSGLLHLPGDYFNTAPLEGEILAKGGEVSDDLQVGDTVLVFRFASDSVKEIEKGIHLMPESSVIAKIERVA